MQSFKMIFSGVTILQGVEFPIFPIDFAWALQQCSATALPVINIIDTGVNTGLNPVYQVIQCICVWQGTSVLSPIGPIGLLIGLAVTIWVKSPTDVFQNNIVLYIVSFGMAASKISNKLVVSSHLISSHLLFFKNSCQTQLCTKFIQVYNADIG